MFKFDSAAFIKQLQTGEIRGVSLDDMRNTNANSMSSNGKIKLLKKEKGTYFQLFVLKQLSIPFNPFTAEVDETYSVATPFSPAKPSSLVALALKAYYNENPEIKEKFMKLVGVEKWDTTDVENITKDDFTIFNRYAEPFRYSYRVVHTSDETISGNQYGADFLVDIQRNEVNDLVEEWTDRAGNVKKLSKYTKGYLDLAGLLRSAALNKYNEWEKSQEGSVASKEQKATKKMSFLSESPFGMDRFKSEILLFALKSPMSAGTPYNNSDALEMMKPENVKKALFKLGYTPTKLGPVIDKLKTGEHKKRDTHLDFYEIAMSIPQIDDDTERGQKTTYESAAPDNNLSTIENETLREGFIKGMIETLDSYEDLDEVVKASSYDRPLTEEVVSAIYEVSADKIDINKLVLGEKTVKFYEPLITEVWAEKATALLTKYDAEMLPEGGLDGASKELLEATGMFNEDDEDANIDLV